MVNSQWSIVISHFVDRQDLLLFFLRDVLELMDVVVGEFLDFGQAVLFVVLGDGFVFEHLL